MAQIPRLKSNKKYKDAPRYPLIYDYEGAMKRNYGKTLGQMAAQLSKKMAKFVADNSK